MDSDRLGGSGTGLFETEDENPLEEEPLEPLACGGMDPAPCGITDVAPWGGAMPPGMLMLRTDSRIIWRMVLRKALRNSEVLKVKRKMSGSENLMYKAIIFLTILMLQLKLISGTYIQIAITKYKV